jgi:hypothetical protein
MEDKGAKSMIRSRLFVVAAIAAVFFLSIAVPTERALAQTTTVEVQEDASGVWSGRRSYMGFSTEISFDIKQTGEKIQGVGAGLVRTHTKSSFAGRNDRGARA